MLYDVGSFPKAIGLWKKEQKEGRRAKGRGRCGTLLEFIKEGWIQSLIVMFSFSLLFLVKLFLSME